MNFIRILNMMMKWKIQKFKLKNTKLKKIFTVSLEMLVLSDLSTKNPFWNKKDLFIIIINFFFILVISFVFFMLFSWINFPIIWFSRKFMRCYWQAIMNWFFWFISNVVTFICEKIRNFSLSAFLKEKLQTFTSR